VSEVWEELRGFNGLPYIRCVADSIT
jgi:hypothetical protein